MPQNAVLVLGIGNPILTDDAIGILVAREISNRGFPGVDVEEVSASGIEIMEMMLDHSKVIIIDAIKLPDRKPGEIMRLGEEDFTATVHGSSPHGVNLSTAIALGRQITPDRMPGEIVFFAMQAEDVSTFHEGTTSSISKMLPKLVSIVEREVLSAPSK